MTIKNVRFVMRSWIFIIIIFIASTLSSYSAPWAAVGDLSLRNDVEILASNGLITGPANTWPMSWKQITRNLYKADGKELPIYVRRALMRVREKVPNEFNLGARMQVTNNPAIINGFEQITRNDFDSGAYLEYNGDNGTTIHIEGGYRIGNNDEYSHLDGSYISQDIGNWATYAGAIDRWWGPGQESTLILSNNARPMPSIGLRRIEAKSFKNKWLKWVGPWQWDMFLAKMEEDRHISKPMFVGMRLSFEPIKNFEIGLSRTLQLCGEGRPCDFNSWTKALVSIGDLDNPTELASKNIEPGNQLASIDLSYTTKVGNSTFLKIYAEGTAEDLLVFLPYEYAKLIGLSLFGPLGNDGGKWHVSSEFSDTISTLIWFGGRRKESVHYNHHIYKTGYRYKGKVIGNNLDVNSQLITLTANIVTNQNWNYTIKYHNALINKNGDQYFYQSSSSSNEERINLISFNVTKDSPLGEFSSYIRMFDDSPNTPNVKQEGIDGGFSWAISY